jgi:hypothetical protein
MKMIKFHYFISAVLYVFAHVVVCVCGRSRTYLITGYVQALPYILHMPRSAYKTGTGTRSPTAFASILAQALRDAAAPIVSQVYFWTEGFHFGV